MKWFGASWGAPVYEPHEHVETPVGDPCTYCDKPIEADAIGVTFPIHPPLDGRSWLPFHHACFIQSCGLESIMNGKEE